MTDCFGITKIYPTETNGREWFCKWNVGNARTYKFGEADPKTDPELIFRGSGKYTIYGATNERVGQMMVTGACPRIYVRNSAKLSSTLPSSVQKWENVEITFYVNTASTGNNVCYAGVEAVLSNHYPDSDLCTTRGYGGKMNWDGRMQIEKECCHGISEKQVATVRKFPNGGKMPLNQWFGYKFICRTCENNTKYKLELYLDMSDCKNEWVKVTEFTDYAGWSSNVTPCCEKHRGKILNDFNKYSVYLRTDGLGKQYYKKFSIREIDALP